MRFWDSSGLVPLILEEPMTGAMESLHEEDTEVVLWWGSVVECASAIARAARENQIDRGAEQRAGQTVDRLQGRVFEVQPSDEARPRALRLLRVHSLRAADALQLAAALTWCRERPRGAGFICLDGRLREAAAREGFDVLPAKVEER